MPWSGFDLINAFNAWKRSAQAGVDDEGRSGLVWRSEECPQVFEEAAVDLGRALGAFSTGRKDERRGKRPRFPKFKSTATLGVVRVRESTRRLRRMLRKGRAKILFATVSTRSEGRELERIESPRPLRSALPKLRHQSRALSRKQNGSRNRRRARERLSRTHGRIRNIRLDFVHRHSTRLAQPTVTWSSSS